MVKRDCHKRCSLQLHNTNHLESGNLRPFRMSWINEKELLQRMSGHRRRQRSSTVGNGLEIDTDNNSSESEINEEEKESCFYRPSVDEGFHSNHSNTRSPLAGGWRSSSVKDLHRSSPIYSQSPENVMFYNNKAMKRLSIKPEQDEFDDGDISDTSSSSSHSSFSSYSSSPNRQHYHSSMRTPERRKQLLHARSVDNILTSPRMNRKLSKVHSFEDLLSSNRPSSCENRKNIGIRRTSYKGSPSTNLLSLHNSLMTSSYRNLAERNVRDHFNIDEPKKTLKTSSPYLERRLAEAKQRHSKREEALRKLDTDFTKAKEIMKKYKSNENIVADLPVDTGDGLGTKNDINLTNGDDKHHYNVI